MKLKISVIVPIYNEEGNIKTLYERIKTTFQKITSSYEVIFIDDGSYDNSLNILRPICKKDNHIKIISFSRNFGHMPAITAGLVHSKGEKVVVMDADLQDPPHIIEKMYKKSLQGYDVVYGVKRKRKENFVRRFLFKTFYKLFDKISFLKMPIDAGTFSILDRKIVNIIIDLPEKNKYFSGLRAWTGFKQTGVIYERSKRYTGNEASFSRLFKLAMDGIVSFSFVPLRIASILGFVFSGFAFVLIVILFILKFFINLGIMGWTSTISSILFMGGVQLITLGIIGEYLARIYDEVKKRPEYLVHEKIGFH